MSACFAGARVTSEVARLEALSISGPTLLSLQPLPSAPPLSSPSGTETQKHQQSAADSAPSPPQPASADGQAALAQSQARAAGSTTPPEDSTHQRLVQQHTAAVMPLPTSAGATRTGQRPSWGALGGNSSISAAHLYDPAATTTPANVANLRRPPEDIRDRQSDCGSCDSHFDTEPTTVSGAPHEFQSMIGNPLAGVLHHGKLAGACHSSQVLA